MGLWDLVGLSMKDNFQMSDSDLQRAEQEMSRLANAAQAAHQAYFAPPLSQANYTNAQYEALLNQRRYAENAELRAKVSQLEEEVTRLKKDRFDLNLEERIDVSHADWQRQKRELDQLDHSNRLFLAAIFGQGATILILVGLLICR